MISLTDKNWGISEVLWWEEMEKNEKNPPVQVMVTMYHLTRFEDWTQAAPLRGLRQRDIQASVWQAN